MTRWPIDAVPQGVTTIDIERTDILTADAVRDPYALFSRLRESGDIHWLPRHQAWLLLDYDSVRSALQDDVLFSTDTITPLYGRLTAEDREKFKAVEELFKGWMIFNDPPIHTMLRKPVASAFTPRGIAGLKDQIEQLTDELLDTIEPGSEQDFVSSVAFPLPASVIGALLGVPAERYEDMRQWSKQLGSLVMGKVSRSDAWDRALIAAQEMQEYFRELIAFNRAHPGDNLVTRMIVAAEADWPLTDAQLIGACSLLLFGGHETTTSLLTTGVHLFSQDSEARRVLLESTAAESAVEELLRFDGPSKNLVRRVREDREWRGHQLRAGQTVFCSTAAANRDPVQFPDPDRLVLDRSPNRHVGFGVGQHFCLGNQLARLEAQVAIPRVLRRFPNLRVTCEDSELSWHPTIVGRTLKRLPVSFS